LFFIAKGQSMFWKIYAWFIFLIFSVAYITTKPFGVINVIDLIISFPSLVGLFLYAYRKRWLSVVFWKTYLPVYFLWDICFNYVIIPKIENRNSDFLTIISGFVLIFPLWVALYLYVFKFLAEKQE